MYMGVDIANERHSNWLHISFILFSVVRMLKRFSHFWLFFDSFGM